MSLDTERKVAEARLRKPVRTVLMEAGYGPASGGSWASFRCPFCQHPAAAGVHAKAGPELFRCFNNGGKKHAPCPSGNRSLDEVGILAVLTNSSRRDAFQMWLQQAGLWEEGRERLGPSTLPGSRPRKFHTVIEPPPAPEDDAGETAEAAAETTDSASTEDSFSPNNISEDIVGNDLQATATPAPSPTVDPALTAPAPSPAGDDDVPGLPPPALESTSGPVAGSWSPEDPDAEPAGEVSEDLETEPGQFTDPSVFKISGEEVSEWISKVESGAGEAPAAAASGAATPAGRARARVVVTGDEVSEAVKWFYSRLVWREEDVRALRLKRGLEIHTQRIAGLRANRFENLRLLQAMHVPGSPRFPLEVLLKAGLWERSWDTKQERLEARHYPPGFTPELVEGCHPARHFFGYSFTGSQKAGDGEKRPTYDWIQAPLIPYFDHLPETEEPTVGWAGVTEGEFKALAWWQIFADDTHLMPDPDVDRLLTIRPHKHWSRGATPHTYLLPPTGGIIQWHGRRLEVGVAALPGITFGRKRGGTWATRHELDEWLRLTQAEVVCVVFDSEEKGDPDLPTYNPDVDARFDSVTWGLALARSLGRDRAAGLVELPEEWRDRKGKADWDGVLSRMMAKKWPVEAGGLENPPSRGGGAGGADA